MWAADTSRVLVAINNRLGKLIDVLVLRRRACEVSNLIWRGISRQRTYVVQVYGLKRETLQDSQHHQAKLYSVDAVKKIVISSNVLSGQSEEADLRDTYEKDRMLDYLGSEDNFKISVREEEPLTYSLKPRLPQQSTASMYIIYNERLKEEYLMMSSDSCLDSIPLLPICHSRTRYRVQAVALTERQSCNLGSPIVVGFCHRPCGKSNSLEIKTCMAKEELQTLLERAESFCRSNRRYPGRYNIRQFYRNKPWRYYKDIRDNRAGLMEKYIKDNNGDPYSPINNQINGLFFSASLNTRTMRPPPFSYFGDYRLFVPAEELFTADTKMYFTDFFCHFKTHYVTIVLTKNGSAEDRFCKPRLLELDPKSNPFFTVTEQRRYQYPRSYQDPFSTNSSSSQLMVQKTFTMVSVNKFHVEFLYTEDVDIANLTKKCGYGLSKNDKVYFQFVEGRGESKKDGIPKNPSCRICNLDPPSLPYHFLPSI